MKTFNLLNGIEIDLLDKAIQETDGNTAVVTALRQHRKRVVREYNALVDELKQIEKDDPEIYQTIYWHDIRGHSWTETFNKVYPGMLSCDPVSYARNRVVRYLNKREDLL